MVSKNIDLSQDESQYCWFHLRLDTFYFRRTKQDSIAEIFRSVKIYLTGFVVIIYKTT